MAPSFAAQEMKTLISSTRCHGVTVRNRQLPLAGYATTQTNQHARDVGIPGGRRVKYRAN